jgi:hypothetical protein
MKAYFLEARSLESEEIPNFGERGNMATINIQPSVLDLMLYAGDGVEFRLICTDSDNSPIDVTGAVKAQIRLDRLNDDPPIVEFSVGMLDAYQGIIVLSLTGAQTQELVDHPSSPPGKFSGVWDVAWEPSAAQPRTLCQGRVECVADVTR